MFASAIVSMGASCSTVLPTNPSVAASPLPASRPTAVGLTAIGAIGQSRDSFGATGSPDTSIAVAPFIARRFDLLEGLSLDAVAGVGAYRRAGPGGIDAVVAGSARLWLGPDGPVSLGGELAVLGVGYRVVPPSFAWPLLETRLLAAWRLPGPGSLSLTTRPGVYHWAIMYDPRLALLEWPLGVTFDVQTVRIGAELGIDWWPGGGVWGARANASAAATF